MVASFPQAPTSKVGVVDLSLIELQNSLGLTHKDLEQELGIVIPDTSMLENQEAIDVITLSEYIKAQERKFKNSCSFSRKGNCSCPIR